MPHAHDTHAHDDGVQDTSEYQTHWHADELEGSHLANTPGTMFVQAKWDWWVQDAVAKGTPGRVVDVGCGPGRELAWLTTQGWEAWGVDPSIKQLREAQERARRNGRELNLVIGLAEWLPLRTGSFDALINKSALDHMVDRDQAVGDFARVLKPHGRAVVSANNYASLGANISRLMYRVLRLVWPSARGKQYFWDTPVGSAHTYEATFQNTRDLGLPHFKELRTFGVSLLWGTPVVNTLLGWSPNRLRFLMLRVLDKIARRLPRLADIIVFVWQPRSPS